MGFALERPEPDSVHSQLVVAEPGAEGMVPATVRRLLVEHRESVRTALTLGVGLLVAELVHRVGRVGERPSGFIARANEEVGAGLSAAITVQTLHAHTHGDNGSLLVYHSVMAVRVESGSPARR